jgi:UDP-2,3-diacylglucosamine pyrophosphatase LpxH
MKIFIWPDIHNRIDILIKFLEHNYSNYDEIIFLGDFFDNLGDKIEETKATANFINETISAKWVSNIFTNILKRLSELNGHPIYYSTKQIP